MNVKELMIGNLVSYQGNMHKVTELMSGHVSLEWRVMIPIEEIEPLPLDKSVLDSMGFSTEEYKLGYTAKQYRDKGGTGLDFVLTLPTHLGEWQSDYTFELLSHRIVPLKHVHQLQNFYFGITGQNVVSL